MKRLATEDDLGARNAPAGLPEKEQPQASRCPRRIQMGDSRRELNRGNDHVEGQEHGERAARTTAAVQHEQHGHVVGDDLQDGHQAVQARLAAQPLPVMTVDPGEDGVGDERHTADHEHRPRGELETDRAGDEHSGQHQGSHDPPTLDLPGAAPTPQPR